jgi:hypothetical protein
MEVNDACGDERHIKKNEVDVPSPNSGYLQYIINVLFGKRSQKN